MNINVTAETVGAAAFIECLTGDVQQIALAAIAKKTNMARYQALDYIEEVMLDDVDTAFYANLNNAIKELAAVN